MWPSIKGPENSLQAFDPSVCPPPVPGAEIALTLSRRADDE